MKKRNISNCQVFVFGNHSLTVVQQKFLIADEIFLFITHRHIVNQFSDKFNKRQHSHALWN